MKDAFLEIRKACTPWCAVVTTDYRAVIRTLLEVRTNGDDGDGTPPAVSWNCIDGHRAANEEGIDAAQALGDPDMTAMAPVMMLKSALALPNKTILFMVIPDAKMLGDAAVAQAISNLRDDFKGNRRTLVFVGPDVTLPSMVRADIPVIYDPLPNADEIQAIAKKVFKDAEVKPKAGELERAAETLAGMTRFACEEGLAHKLRKSGLDFKGLADLQRSVIEESTERVLTYEREPWTFDKIGGLENFKSFMQDLFKGPAAPNVIVRVDEIDKVIGAGSSGAVADNTNVSQDILGVLLRNMEDNKWLGLMAAGGPGTGKTLASICTGNTFGVRTLVFDINKVKTSALGASEQRIRQVMDVLQSISGGKLLFMATANRLDTLPPELQARFWLGTWFWDVPNAVEKRNIWQIQREAFKIPAEMKAPDDADWVGRDIRNCCKMAWASGTDLEKAAKRITIAGRSSKESIERLRDTAERCGFLSANEPGPYRKPKSAAAGRKLAV